MIARPYIGIDGVGDFQEHGRAIDVALAQRMRPDADRFLMFGVDTTSDLLLGLGDAADSAPSWYHDAVSIVDAAGNEDSGLSEVFVVCDITNPEDLPGALNMIHRRTFHFRNGIQLNLLPWMEQDYRPTIKQLQLHRESEAISLGIGRDELLSHRPINVADRVAQLAVDFVSLNLPNDELPEVAMPHLMPYIDAIHQLGGKTLVAVAANFKPEAFDDQAGALVEAYPDISLTAGAVLRTQPQGLSLDMLQIRTLIGAWQDMKP